MQQPINDLAYRFGLDAVTRAAADLGLDVEDWSAPMIRRELVRRGAQPATDTERAKAWQSRRGFAWIEGMRVIIGQRPCVVVEVDGSMLSVFDRGAIRLVNSAPCVADLSHPPTAALCERAYTIDWARGVLDDGMPRTLHAADVLSRLGAAQ